MKLYLLLLLLFAFLSGSGQSADNIQKTIDSLQAIKNNLLIKENPLKLKKLQNEMDSLKLEKYNHLITIEKLDKQILEIELKIRDINYDAARINPDNIKVISAFRLPLYSEPNSLITVKSWVDANSEIILLGYDHSSHIEFIKISYNGLVGYINYYTIQEDKPIRSIVDEFVERQKKKVIKIERSYESTNSTRSSTYGDTHYYRTGPRGGKYYINKNGNKTYKKRN